MPTALITGASRGVGAAIARQLAPTHDLLLGGRPSAELDALATELDGASTWPVELTDPDEVEAATEAISELDVLVHSAGVGGIAPVEDLSTEEWQRILAVNLIAAAEVTRLLLPALRTASGHVVFINSGAGRNARPGWGAYAASKFGLRAFADSLRGEEPDLRVTSVYPGRIDTDMQRELVAIEGDEYDPSKFLTPETVARAVVSAVTTPADAHPTEIVLRPTGRA
ncbi:SDR family oxidoreductase [Williamsia sterculiae]|uniref:NADP-dependent 3-hydroxy acid dehydrogenase YdfG n=1 Tax=Williamsia sterculiae TaxID=1344003 RepID=A0A1N7FH57_9NOCA|nr:SDR family oxidoreductase [Williamsia sterculiae]SIR99768.1 NADP-dependent 3-hydroxy acid dehydrogenase YdfG [Williamsia sterculiae]